MGKKHTKGRGKHQQTPKKKGAWGKTPSKAELYKRLEAVEEAMEDGIYAPKDLVAYLESKGFPTLAGSTVRGYVKRVRDQWASERESDRKKVRDAAIKRIEKLYRKVAAKLEGRDPNYGDAVALLRELHKIQGVYAPEQHEVRSVGEFAGYTDAELDRYLKDGTEPARLAKPTVKAPGNVSNEVH